jgi:hypothetical protein
MVDSNKLQALLKKSIRSETQSVKSSQGRIYLSEKSDPKKKQPRGGNLRLPRSFVIDNAVRFVSIILDDNKTIYILINVEEDGNKIELRRQAGKTINMISSAKTATTILKHLELFSDKSISKTFLLEKDEKQSVELGVDIFKFKFED